MYKDQSCGTVDVIDVNGFTILRENFDGYYTVDVLVPITNRSLWTLRAYYRYKFLGVLVSGLFGGSLMKVYSPQLLMSL